MILYKTINTTFLDDHDYFTVPIERSLLTVSCYSENVEINEWIFKFKVYRNYVIVFASHDGLPR